MTPSFPSSSASPGARDRTGAARACAETILGACAEPVLLLDHDLRAVAASAAFLERFLPRGAPLAGASLAALGRAWSDPRLAVALRCALENGAAIRDFELTGEFGPAGARALRLDAQAAMAVAPPDRLIAISIQDVTERRQMRDRFDEIAARYDLILESAPEAIVTVDDAGLVTSVSSAAETLFGYEAAELHGRPVDRILPGARNGTTDGFALIRETDRRKQVTALTRAGEAVPLDLTSDVARYDHRHVFIGVFRDLSVELVRQEELRRLRQMEALARLIGGVAHDFNNLLAVIGGSLELLDPENHPEQTQALIADALEAVDHGARLTGQLLAFGGRAPSAPTEVDLNAEAAAVGSLADRTIGEDIAVATRLGDGPLVVDVDMAMLRTALLNLVNNARDAMPRGGAVSIETGRRTLSAAAAARIAEASPGRFAVVTIRDDGAGMPAEVLERAGEPYFTTKPGAAGNGLGLSMAIGFVRQAGGFVEIRSAPEEGTSVSLHLPLIDRDPAPLPKPIPAARAVSADAAADRTVLVVEDDARVRRSVCRRLRALGYVVRKAADGDAALRDLRSNARPDLLMTDIVMPGGLDGVALAEAARAIAPDLPVLFTSGYPLSGSALPRGATVLRKPYDRPALLEALRRALDG